MPTGYPRQHCKVCGGHRSEVGELSSRGKCDSCADALQLLNHRDLRAHTGPFFDHWRRRSLAALGVITLDDDGGKT